MKTKMSILLIVLSMVAVLALGIATTVKAQGVELGDGVVITAEVVAIDRVDRTVVLLGPQGNAVAVQVGHEARNFEQIQIGDMVKVSYYESVALYLGKKGQKPEASAGLLAARSAKGDKPGGIVVKAIDVFAKVQAIDKGKRRDPRIAGWEEPYHQGRQIGQGFRHPESG